MLPADRARPPRERAINMPAVLVAAIAVLVAVHGLREWLDDETVIRLFLELAFIPATWTVAAGFATADQVVEAARAAAADAEAAALRLDWARFVVAHIGPRPWTWLSYAVLHGSWMHVALNVVWLAAFGTPVVRRAGPWRSLLLTVATAVGGAAAQWAAHPLSAQPVIGASAVVSGFMAAAVTFVFARRRRLPPWIAPPKRPAAPDWSFLRDRTVLGFLAAWFVANLLFGVAAVPFGLAEGDGIAWEAHIGGFLVGLVLFPLIDPGPPSDAGAEPAA